MQSQQQWAVPISIIIAGMFIAGAVYMSNTATAPTQNAQAPKQERQVQPQGSTDKVAKVTKSDHIKGNPNADVIVVEYSDYECPFCKRFHETMNDIIDAEGDSGNVAWVFRHFPLDQLHPKNARKVAVASECVAAEGGNDAFWAFTDAYMRDTLTNDRTDIATLLPKLYKEVGVDQSKVEACIASKKYDAHVQENIDNAIATGGRGTPWSVVIGKDGKTYALNGAQPKSAVQQILKIAGGQ